jgi:ABC-type bacteriocin/lantibiotic exporter with double-glycine peptidase domain
MIVPKEKSLKPTYCGPAAFTMVAKYYGHDITQQDFVRGVQPTAEGLFFSDDLVQRGRELGFQVSEYKNCNLDDIAYLLDNHIPPIALVNRNVQSPHAIVVTGYDDVIRYNDPADLRRSKMPISRFNIMWENFSMRKHQGHLIILEDDQSSNDLTMKSLLNDSHTLSL